MYKIAGEENFENTALQAGTLFIRNNITDAARDI